MKKRRINMAFYFTMIVFSNMVTSVFFIGLLVITLHQFGVTISPNPFSLLLFFGIASVSVGTFFSRFFGAVFLKSINEITEGTKAITSGNLDYRLKEKNDVYEMQQMRHNFNIMAQELQNTEIFRNDFVRNVSHEIKTPLSTIEGYATLLQNEHLDNKTKNYYVQKIIQNTMRLSTLTSNVLLLSKIENQEIATDFASYCLDEQIRQCILSLESLWAQKNLGFDLDLDPINYYGNENLLSHVWTNILSNAMKFSHDDGEIHISLHESTENIQVIIIDDGIGMSQEVKKRIFEKFYQGDTSHKSSGNGLGLTLASRIVNIHDGKIEVESKENEGTTFIVTLPKK